MICTNCGTACPDGAKFCMECAAPIKTPEFPLPEEFPVFAPAEKVNDALFSQEDPILAESDTDTSAVSDESVTGASPAMALPAHDASAIPADPDPIPEVPELFPEEEFIPEAVPVFEAGSIPKTETDTESDAATTPEPPQMPQFPQDTDSPYRIPMEHPPVQAAPPPARKGSHWVPIVIMAVLCVFGLSLFLALPFDTPDRPAVSDSETPWFYNIDGTLYFQPELYHGPEELTVPDTVDGLPVTNLAPYCFADCAFTTVILPDSLHSISEGAFSNCSSMRGIFLPEGLTYIGTDAFYRCTVLEAICIPSTVETIESGAFDGCFKLSFILYNGIHSHWLDLYGDMIGKKTQVYCTDGTFVQRKSFP